MNEKDTDLEFQYGDCDTFETEIAELYSYSEIPEFEENKKKFREFLLVEGKKMFLQFCSYFIDTQNLDIYTVIYLSFLFLLTYVSFKVYRIKLVI